MSLSASHYSILNYIKIKTNTYKYIIDKYHLCEEYDTVHSNRCNFLRIQSKETKESRHEGGRAKTSLILRIFVLTPFLLLLTAQTTRYQVGNVLCSFQIIRRVLETRFYLVEYTCKRFSQILENCCSIDRS